LLCKYSLHPIHERLHRQNDETYYRPIFNNTSI
jgi:hypothetical protein